VASRHDDLTAAGARVVGISVDDPGRNAAMVDKLHLPFPLLADPDGEGAIKPYDVWNAEEKGGIAHPAAVLVGPDGEEAFRTVGGDFADRPTEDELLDEVRALGLDPVEQAAPTPGKPQPSDRALKVRSLVPYFLGGRFTAMALGMRLPDAEDEVARYVDEMDRWVAAVKALPRD
jgi:alkyl hydroperoxide reductase subunit AhpC